ncbi:MAG TPA: hypothetical protein VFD39_09610 [Trueperaceae bacterium]|nr:hypothetical protein [Trueperaceae bacterium]
MLALELEEGSVFLVEQAGFSGSLGELAHALRSRALAPEKIDIYQLVKAYLDYLGSFPDDDLEFATEALPRVAQVVELKLRLLLPRPRDELSESPEEVMLEEALEAVALLEELEHAIAFLKRRRQERRVVVPARAPRPHYPRALRPVTASLGDLARLAGRYRLGGYFELELAGATVASVAARLLAVVRRALSGGLFGLVAARGWQDKALVFAGMLELVREGKLVARQEEPFGPITVSLPGSASAAVGPAGARALSQAGEDDATAVDGAAQAAAANPGPA